VSARFGPGMLAQVDAHAAHCREAMNQYPAYCIRYEGTELALDESVATDIFVSRPCSED